MNHKVDIKIHGSATKNKETGMYTGHVTVSYDGEVIRTMSTKREYTESELDELKTIVSDLATRISGDVKELATEQGHSLTEEKTTITNG